MRSGGPGRPSASASSSSAASVLPSSASQRACSRARVSVALRVARTRQLALLPALRHAEVDRPAAAPGEERLEDRRSRRSAARHVDLARDRRRPGRSTARGSWSGPRRRSPRGRHRAGRRRGRSSCRRGSRTAGWPPGCPGGRGRACRARSGRRRPSSGSPSSARSPGSCRAGRRPARSRSARRRRHLGAEGLDQRLLAALEEELDLLDVLRGSRPWRWP